MHLVYFLLEDEIKYSTKKVKCYDAHHNEIVGQTCLDKENLNENGMVTIVLCFLTAIGFILCFVGATRLGEGLAEGD